MNAVAERAAQRAQARAGRTCPVCGRAIDAQRSTKRYCTPKCRVAAHRAKGCPPVKREGLHPAQVRILKELSLSSTGLLNRRTIIERAEVGVGWVGAYLGRVDPVKRAACEAKSGVPSLVTLGYVKTWILDLIDSDRTERVYEITDAGRQALVAAQKGTI